MTATTTRAPQKPPRPRPPVPAGHDADGGNFGSLTRAEYYAKYPSCRPPTPAAFYRAWAKAIASLRRAEADIEAFDDVRAYTVEEDVEPLADPSLRDLHDGLGSIRWQLQQALRVLDNCTPPAVQLLTGRLAAREGDTPLRAKAQRLVRKVAKEQLNKKSVA